MRRRAPGTLISHKVDVIRPLRHVDYLPFEIRMKPKMHAPLSYVTRGNKAFANPGATFQLSIAKNNSCHLDTYFFTSDSDHKNVKLR